MSTLLTCQAPRAGFGLDWGCLLSSQHLSGPGTKTLRAANLGSLTNFREGNKCRCGRRHAACGTWQRGHRHKIKFSYLRIILPTNKQQQSHREAVREIGWEWEGVRQHQLLQVSNEMKSVCQRSNILFKIPFRFPLEASNLSHRKFASIFS